MTLVIDYVVAAPDVRGLRMEMSLPLPLTDAASRALDTFSSDARTHGLVHLNFTNEREVTAIAFPAEAS